jgi:hypothetical protein
MYIKPPSTAPYSIRQLRLDNPDTSFPAKPSDDLLAEWGVVPVEILPTPEFDPATHHAVLLEPVEVDGGKWVQMWDVRSLTDHELSQRAEDARQAWKEQRTAAVAAIKVTTAAGNTFDGDETSQARMARAILGLQVSSSDTVPWVLADNSVISATAAELQEALALAGAEQARLWVQL